MSHGHRPFRIASIPLLFSALLVTLSPLSPLQGQAPDPAPFIGDWRGTLVVGPQELPIIFHIRGSAEGLTATMDSPAQNARGIPMDEARASGDSLVLTLSMAQARYEGTLTGDDTLTGTWTQGPASLELMLERVPAEDEGASATAGGGGIPDPSTRPQTPSPPFPYRSEDVSFPSAGGIELAGTFTAPEGGGPHPGVILVSGSGPQDRDETIVGHKPFAVLADHLTRAGIAVLRYDDRGVGESEGVFGTATSDDLARDAEGALAYLASRPDVDPDRVGILGHSEGGLIAPLVASRSDLPAFVVLLAGPGMTGREVIEDQSGAMARAQGASEEVIEANLAVSRRLFDIAVEESDAEAAAAEMTRVLEETLAELDAATRAAAGIPEGGEDAFIRMQVGQVNSPWFRAFLAYDPVPALEALTIPVLAINGELDLQVTPESNLSAIRGALQRGGNPDYTVQELPGLNHLFQTATTGLPTEYATLDETMAPEVLELVADWILARFGDGG